VEDLMLEKQFKQGYFGYEPYNLSKQANARCMRKLGKMRGMKNVKVFSVCPGLCQTELFNGQTGITNYLTKTALSAVGLSPEQAIK
jgi:NAD(P)-dependent dehydrogenase (short-subunit alcohol dehydrogenase family)